MRQLMMWWCRQALDRYPLPPGYYLRTYQEGDARGWIAACAAGLDTGSWSEQDFQTRMLNADGIQPKGIFLLTCETGEIVGTATGVLKPQPHTGYLHMVCIKPEHQGKGLSKPLIQAVLDYLVSQGCSRVRLDTDDHRLPAIKTYLTLGFLPAIADADMKSRWMKVLRQLGCTSTPTVNEEGQPGPVLCLANEACEGDVT